MSEKRRVSRRLGGVKVADYEALCGKIREAAKHATTTIPIVILDPGDPVGTGLVASLARPGGNVTGISSIAPDLAAKRLQLLKEAATKISRVAVLFNDEIPPAEIAMKELASTAKALKLDLESLPVKSPNGFDKAFDVMTQQHIDAVIVFADPLTFSNSDIIVNFANRSRRPALYAAQEFVDAGGLMSYGANVREMHRLAAGYVGKILKGAKPGDLPFEQVSRFELVVNLKTAKELGVTFPRTILLQAVDKIE